MTQLTAEMIQRGRGAPDPAQVARKRKSALEIRATRERLVSSTGLEKSFDYELLRVYAQQHVSAKLPLFVLIAVIAAGSFLWIKPVQIMIWLSFMVCSTGLMIIQCTRFSKEPPNESEIDTWRRWFILGEFLQGLSWSLIAFLLLFANGQNAQVFVLFVLMIVAAMTAMLSFAIPRAVHAALIPLMLSMAGFVTPEQNLNGMAIAAMGSGAVMYFVFLTNRLYSSTVSNFESRAEKDALFIELDQAKANSDEARRKAEEANLAKSRFLATMSHELRTPLNAILGFSEVMKNEVFGPHSSPAYKEYSSDVHGSGQHLLNLINEILDLSRIEAGKYELNEEAINIAYITEECNHMMSLRAKTKGQIIHEHIEPKLPRLWADERAVRQIVLNLLSNAIKFTPQGGEITIKTGHTQSGGQYVTVKDTGPGIPEEEMSTVLSSFGRGSLAIKTAEQGSGLGLPIVKGLVDLHGGDFSIKSKVRAGTEVTVTFPASRVMDALAALPEKPRPHRAA
jgi:two-component system, cell cycle sensor histidine kinase PleC